MRTRRKKNKKSFFRNYFFILITASLLIVNAIFLYQPFYDSYDSNLSYYLVSQAFEDQYSTVLNEAFVETEKDENYDRQTDFFKDKPLNILLLGFDNLESRGWNYRFERPDTIMIASINLRTAQVSLLNIPRDSYVKIHGTEEYDKINHAYLHGYRRASEGEDPHESGLKYMLMTVTDFLGGVPINNYVLIDMDDAQAIVDSIGGIYYDVDIEVRSRVGSRRVLVEKGYQLLDGESFLHYVRDRDSIHGGDRGRAERHQKVMLAVFRQFKEAEMLTRLPGIYRALKQYIETDLSLAQVGALGITGMRVEADRIEGFVFSGTGQLSRRNGQNTWYFLIDEEERVRLIQEIFGLTVQKKQPVNLTGPFRVEAYIDPGSEPEPALEPDSSREPKAPG